MKLNLDKMRRNLYRSTPNKITRTFDPLKDGVQAEMRQFVSDFGHAMRLKHGNRLAGILSYRNDVNFDGRLIVTLEARVSRGGENNVFRVTPG